MSPRMRYRYLPRIGAAVVAVLVIAGGVYLATSVLRSGNGVQATPLTNQPAKVYHAQKNIKLQKGVMPVAAHFVHWAVMRGDLRRAWAITDASLKGGLTYKQWVKGSIPVVPYPEGGIAPKVVVQASHKNAATLELALFPKAGSTMKPQVFVIGLARRGSAAPWKVNYWLPRGESFSHAADK